MTGMTHYLKAGLCRLIMVAGCTLLLGFYSAVLLAAANMPRLTDDGFNESSYRDLEVPGGSVEQPDSSGDPQRDGRARMLKNKCMAMVNKKTQQRHVYQVGSLVYGQGAHPGIFVIYVETAAHYRGSINEQWSACGFNSINNLSYLRVHRQVLISRP